MMNPFKFRPEREDFEFEDELEDGSTDWEDNWVSNFLAWASIQLGMDQYEWPSKVMNPFFTDCATCLFWRGLAVGVFTATFFVAITRGLLAIFTGA